MKLKTVHVITQLQRMSIQSIHLRSSFSCTEAAHKSAWQEGLHGNKIILKVEGG